MSISPPPGYTADPNNPGWWLKDGSDPAQPSSWWQSPPAGYVADPANPGWYYDPTKDVSLLDAWWHDATIADEPAQPAQGPEPVIVQVPGVPHRSSRDGHLPVAIVVHTMSGTLAGCDSWFRNPQSEVSAHYGVGLSGAIHQYVVEDQMAWANGRLEPGNTWPLHDGVNPNKVTLSIETEDLRSAATPVSDEQYAAALYLCQRAKSLYPSVRWLMTHHVISPLSRVGCPGNRWVGTGLIHRIASTVGLDLLT